MTNLTQLTQWLQMLPEEPDPELARFIVRAARLAVDLSAPARELEEWKSLRDQTADLQNHPGAGSRYGGRILADIVTRAASLATSWKGHDIFLQRWHDGALQFVPSAGLTAAGPR